ncbi:MAG: PEP-CTERM sorting domain-containing protein [Terriglobia bacterium]
MKKVSRPARIFGMLLLAAGAVATAASADTFNFSYNFPNNLAGPTDSGSGTLTATYNPGDQYMVTGITGTTSAWGKITGLLAPNAFESNDNLIFYPNTPYLDNNFGMSFAAGTTDLNIYYSFSASSYAELGSNNKTFGTFTLTPVPEPATVALVLLAFLAGFLGWCVRRKRSASAYFVE